MSEIGAFLKNKRESVGISQQNLATACGLQHDSTINRIESGERKVTWEELGRISKALGNFHIFEALQVAGFISGEDINPIHRLYHLDELNDDEITKVSDYIEFLIYKKTINRKDG